MSGRFGVARVAMLAVPVSALLSGCFDLSSITNGGPDGGQPKRENDGGAVDGGAADGSESFCASFTPASYTAFFCSDFDEGQALPAPWAFGSQLGATFSVNAAAAAPSPPDSLDELVPALGPNDSVAVLLRTSLAFPPLPTTMKLAMRLDPVTIDTQEGATIVLSALDFIDAAEDRYTVQLSGLVVSGMLSLQLGQQSAEADGGQLDPFQPASLLSVILPLGQFTPIVIEIDWASAGTAQAVVSVNGTTQLDTPLKVAVTPASMNVSIGTTYLAPRPSGAWELRYDNVVLTAN
jgi:hypothetical protein